MPEKWIVTQYSYNLNVTIKQLLRFSQRIKFLCFDVSSNYVVFGANSGSFYVFNRSSCEFLKIIPCKQQGSVTQISISSNEKHLAAGSSKGVVTLLQNCFTDYEVQQQVFTEHLGHSITTLKWHLNELYSGDAVGKITLITIPNVLSKTILHPPCVSLMQLDSSIVQIDCFSVYLLISTNSRTYICNTEKEHYRQIGKQLRKAPIGACIYSNCLDIENATIYTKLAEGLFKNIKDDESVTSAQINENLKFYCGRVDARLWEAKIDGTVTNTYLAKSILENSQIDLILLDEQPDSHLIISNKQTKFKNFTFTKVYRLENFILTFNSEGFFIINPEDGVVIACCNYFNCIRDAKIVEDLIYIWNENGEVSVVGVYDVEKLVLKTLLDRKFVVCGELCLNYLDDLLPLVEISNKLHLVMVLKEKLHEISGDLLEKLLPLFKALEEFSNRRFFEKPTSGIVSVNDMEYLAKTASGIENVGKIELESNNKDEAELHLSLKIFSQRFELSMINSKVEMLKFDNLLTSNTIDDSLELFEKFSKFMVEKGQEEELMQVWCCRYFLKYFSKINFVEELEKRSDEDLLVQFVYTAFCLLNNLKDYGCRCLFPLPSAKDHPPEFYELGCELLRKFQVTSPDRFERIYVQVPFMWKYIITHLKTDQDIDSLLPSLVQYGDDDILLKFLTKFKYDTWDSALQLIIKLNKQSCINCDVNFQQSCDIISWKKFAFLMIQSMGTQNAISLLTRYATFIPSQGLDANFYQTSFFCAIIENTQSDLRRQSIDLVQNLLSNKATASKFEKMLSMFVQEKCMMKTSTSFVNKNVALNHKSGANCLFCELPFNVPILDKAVQLNCNHIFHEICLQLSNNLCVICK